jgi:hypothetical protein
MRVSWDDDIPNSAYGKIKKNMFQTTNQGWGVQLTTILFRSLELITSALPLRTDQKNMSHIYFQLHREKVW